MMDSHWKVVAIYSFLKFQTHVSLSLETIEMKPCFFSTLNLEGYFLRIDYNTFNIVFLLLIDVEHNQTQGNTKLMERHSEEQLVD